MSRLIRGLRRMSLFNGRNRLTYHEMYNIIIINNDNKK